MSVFTLTSQTPPSDALFEHIAQSLETQGYMVLPAALPTELSDALVSLLSHTDDPEFHRAAVGRGTDQTRNQFVRRDQISWIEPGNTDADAWLGWTRRLMTYLNRRLFLGLFSFESHLARYEPGDFYKKHYDAFRGESNRVLSLVTYLNKGWETGHGGELVIYKPDSDDELIRVQPSFGTLVLFLSEEFPHEVLAGNRERYSVAGWFRVNGSIQNAIDPPR